MSKDKNETTPKLKDIDEGIDLELAMFLSRSLKRSVAKLLNDPRYRNQAIFHEDDSMAFLANVSNFNRVDKSVLNLNTVEWPNPARLSRSWPSTTA
jgi:hypothetical protein